MKNIFFYIYKEKQFAPEYILMSEAQIKNSMEFWRPEDILVVTNFPWEFRGVKAHVVSDEINAKTQSHGTSLSNKPVTINYLIKNNLVDEINWFHDWDVFQLAPFDNLTLDCDLGLADYGYSPRLFFGSVFFKPSTLETFNQIEDVINEYKVNEEEALNIANPKITKLDQSFNIEMIGLESNIQKANKPLKIAHVPPHKSKYLQIANQILPPKLHQLLNSRIKNLLVYISPNHKFNPEHEAMIEVQIQNSDQFWKKEDIILLTNFPYEYHGVKAIVAPDTLINKSTETNQRGIINSKVNAAIYLLEKKIITDLTWFHDVDSFQLAPLDLPEINGDLGVVGYGIYPENRLTPLGKKYPFRINFGNFFFKPASLDIFKLLLTKMEETNLYEEDALTILLAENPNIESRVQIMNQTYNIGLRCVRSNIATADKPIRVAHFPPNNPAALHKFSKILPPKLGAMLNAKFSAPEPIRHLQGLKFFRERRVWKDFMQQYNCQRIAEIGIYKGQNFKRMIEHKPELAVAVDAWINDGNTARNDLGHSQEVLDSIYEQFKLEMASHPWVQIYKEYTSGAAKHFADKFFDLIYIDADHSYIGCSKDLEAWYPKVKQGGFLIGDDYNDYMAPVTKVIFGVVQAVNDFATREKLTVYELPSHGWAIIK